MRLASPKPALFIALFLMPDSRPASRRAVIKAAALMEKASDGSLSPKQRKRLGEGFDGAQKAWVGMGVALHALARKNIATPFLFLFAIVFIVYQVISFIIIG